MRRFITTPRLFALWFLINGLALVCVTGLPHADDYRGKWRGYGNLGEAYLKAGRLVEAKKHLKIAIAQNPGFAHAYLNFGNAMDIEGRHADAEAFYLQSLVCDPKLPEAHYNLGNVYVQMGRFSEAVQEFHKQIGLGRYIADSHLNAGYALANMGRHAEAVQEFKAALAEDPNCWRARENIKILAEL